jgi:nitroimidazol reductase NimA-like FMN-containing flavoprotein (pyridoxamine 5'-phosphate oxidase superfamily)
MADQPPTDRTRTVRSPGRGHYDRETIDSILDAGILCHVAYVLDGAPVVTPTLYWRHDDRVYWHGSSASRMLRKSAGTEVCLTVSHLDGIVLARSGFHSSINYRSVMFFGTAEIVPDADQPAVLDHFIEHLAPGRLQTLRPPTDHELKATVILSISINECSAKVRTGPPVDDETDYALSTWAGVIPVTTTLGAPIPDPHLPEATPIPPDVTALYQTTWARPHPAEG